MNEDNKKTGRIDCVLIASGKYHDIDFARLELLKLLAENDRFRVRVFEDYSNLEALTKADFLVTYTCEVIPNLEQQQALRSWVEQGGRWYALHGTNSILRFLDNGLVDTPDWAGHFMDTLGSQFASHPPIGPFTVRVAKPEDPLVQGIEDFQIVDEQYLVDQCAEIEVLLDLEFEGETPGFVRDQWLRESHPVLYRRALGDGAVLYLTLGHCRGHYDLQPLMDYWPDVDRCSWDSPVFYELLRRGLLWASEPAREHNN